MKLLIVGGVAGGASAAARARRLSEDAHIVLFERGPDVSFANCGLPYYLGGEIADRDKLLVVTPERLRTRLNLDVRTRTSVEAIDRAGKKAISLERQVRIATGLLVLLGAILGWLVHPAFVGLSAFVGAGLVFAGVTDTCGMGMLLAGMPWNQVKGPAATCCATKEVCP